MKNTELTLNKVTNVYDIINFIKGNVNDIDKVVAEVKRVCGDNLIVKPYHEKAYILTYTHDGIAHEIICGSHYSPYPNVKCFVL